jgi:hypothetical protein
VLRRDCARSSGAQGVFLDTDGSLLSALPDSIKSQLSWGVGVPGTTWHSAINSELFDPAECVYVRGAHTSNNGALCSPALTFRCACGRATRGAGSDPRSAVPCEAVLHVLGCNDGHNLRASTPSPHHAPTVQAHHAQQPLA